MATATVRLGPFFLSFGITIFAIGVHGLCFPRATLFWYSPAIIIFVNIVVNRFLLHKYEQQQRRWLMSVSDDPPSKFEKPVSLACFVLSCICSLASLITKGNSFALMVVSGVSISLISLLILVASLKVTLWVAFSYMASSILATLMYIREGVFPAGLWAMYPGMAGFLIFLYSRLLHRKIKRCSGGNRNIGADTTVAWIC